LSLLVFVPMTYLPHSKLSAYLQIPLAGRRELTVFCSAMIGGPGISCGFKLPSGPGVHGDTGRWRWRALGIVAVLIISRCCLVIAGGVFVMEAGS